MERKELLDELDKLKAGYIASRNALDVMKNWGKTQLEALYATKIGRYKIELLELQIEFKSLKKKIQLYHQAINQNLQPDFGEIEARVAQIAKNAYQEINFEKDKVTIGKAVLSNLASPEDSVELRKIYREIAKILHPDINPDLSEKQHELWHMFHSAYKNGDLDQIKALKIVFEEDLKNATEKTELSEEQILLQTSALKQGIAEIETQISELEKEFPFNIADEIRDDEWVAEQQDIIKKDIEELSKAVAKKREIYQLIRETYE